MKPTILPVEGFCDMWEGSGAVVAFTSMSSFNKSRVLGAVWLNEKISRIDIARMTGLDKSTITNIVSSLISAGLIMEVSEGTPGPLGGRKPVHLSLNRKFGYVLGLELQPECLSAVLVDLYGGIIRDYIRKRKICSDNLIQVFLDFISEIRGDMKMNGERLLGIGVGVSGIINPMDGIIHKSIPLGIREPFPFLTRIQDYCKVPVYIENDANACAWGELAFRKNEQLKNFLSILIEFREEGESGSEYGGVAVGMGIVIGGRVYYGEDFSAGEFKSAFASPGGETQFSLSKHDLFLVRKDPVMFGRFAEDLALNVALMVNTFNFKQVFLMGQIENYAESISRIILEKIQRNWPYPGSVGCSVSPSAVGTGAVAYGTAGMFLEHFFNRPGSVPGGESAIPEGIDLLFRNEQH